MYICQPAERIILNFSYVLGKNRKKSQAPANFRHELKFK